MTSNQLSQDPYVYIALAFGLGLALLLASTFFIIYQRRDLRRMLTFLEKSGDATPTPRMESSRGK